MIDNNKLLSKNQVSRGRNIVTIKRNLIKINNLLKERLVLTKVRQGIMMQEEENRIRRQSEDDLESLEPTRKIEDDKPKDDKKNSGLLAALATLGLLFLPGLKKLLNFLNDIKDRVGNMAKLLLKAMTDFKDKAFAFLNKVNLANFDKEKIQTSFAKLEKDLKNFVNTLVFAAVTNFAVSTLGKLSGFNIQNLIRRGRKTKVDDVLDDVPVGEDRVPFETGIIKRKSKIVKPEKVFGDGADAGVKSKVKKSKVTFGKGSEEISRLENKLNEDYFKMVDFIEDILTQRPNFKVKGLPKNAIANEEFFLGSARSGLNTLARNFSARMNESSKVLQGTYKRYIDAIDSMIQKYDRAIEMIKKPNNKQSIEELLDFKGIVTKNMDEFMIKNIREGKKLLNKIKRGSGKRNNVKKYLGGLATLGQYTLGEQGPEFIIDADSTLAIENTAPGFLNALNQAEGFQSIDVLRNYASYEGGHLQTASFFPVFIPTPSNKKSQVMLAVSGGDGSRQTIFSKIHDKR